MYVDPNNRLLFKNKFGSYINYKNLIQFIAEYEHHKYYFNFIYNTNQIGGNLEQINEILKNYPNYNVEIDEAESNDNEIKIQFFTINRNHICLALIIDNVKKFATIGDLRNYDDCIPLQDENLTRTLIKFSSELAKQSKMKSLKLSDRSYYTCKGDNPLKNHCDTTNKTFILSMANTLTDGIPYYYKYGFVYEQHDEHKRVRKNIKKLNILSSELNYEKMFKMINKRLIKIKCSEQIKTQCFDIVANLYEKNFNNNVKDFFKELKYQHCFLFCLIYNDLWDVLKLNTYRDHMMIMSL